MLKQIIASKKENGCELKRLMAACMAGWHSRTSGGGQDHHGHVFVLVLTFTSPSVDLSQPSNRHTLICWLTETFPASDGVLAAAWCR
ncbi:hypothetical protein Cob_v000372 [Colletotrichum orbiculare MAFF 240422]|uniref:Uncharacterized protein n=1 Tax=Colletotrichum orbiculare (strain 104-T / ATCC 96160 / CBS 514.97 / LARS 414 / MAFF 240422) TaxID=1213857 RepID=A0A484G937_COLOR|nr:hypothetical protein Cob_v000372 [Colletotrichum orbiculare MAFF 240422]